MRIICGLILSNIRSRMSSSRKFVAQSRSLSNAFDKGHANSDLVLVEQHDEVVMIGINRPQVRNCVNIPTGKALLKAFEDFDANSSAKIAVLYGEGGNFCAGFDLKELSGRNAEDFIPFTHGPMGPSRYMSKKPVIGAIEGYAVAGGFELALWCDLRVVEENAVMGVFCRRFGVPLIDGGTVRLPAIVGYGRAMDLILTGRPIKADEALQWGLANRVVSCGTAIGQAVNLANQLCKFPQLCMLADRESARYSTFSASALVDALEFEHENGVPIIAKESIGGAQKFVSGIGRHGKFNIDANPSFTSKL